MTMKEKVAKVCVEHHFIMMGIYGVLNELNLIKDSTMIVKSVPHLQKCTKHMKTLNIDTDELFKKAMKKEA